MSWLTGVDESGGFDESDEFGENDETDEMSPRFLMHLEDFMRMSWLTHEGLTNK